jgi:hypothetical protein
VLDTKSPKYLEMAQGHISLSVRSLPPQIIPMNSRTFIVGTWSWDTRVVIASVALQRRGENATGTSLKSSRGG